MKKVLFIAAMLVSLILQAQEDVIFPVDISQPVVRNCQISKIDDINFVSYTKDGYVGQVRARYIIIAGEHISFFGDKIADIEGQETNIPFYSIKRFYNQELAFEKNNLKEINEDLKNMRIMKGIGIGLTLSGVLAGSIGAANDYQTLAVVGGVASIAGLIMWIASPTKHISYQKKLTENRIWHLERMQKSYDISLNLIQPDDMMGLGLRLKF